MAFKDQDGVFAWLESGEGKGLIPLDRGILLTLARYINSGTGLSYPGTERLARLWGVSRRAVEKSLARLRQAGLVVVAQRATGQRYARYRIILAESSPHPGVDYSEEVAHTQRSSSPHSGVKKPTLRGGRISESSLSQSEVMTTPSDDDASLTGVTASAKPSDWVSDPVFGEVAGTLGLDEQATRSWITDRLGRAAGPVRNRDSYIRTALEHNRADVARGKKKAATRMTPREALDRIAELAGAEVVVHGNEAEVEVWRGGVGVFAYVDPDQPKIVNMTHTWRDAGTWPDSDAEVKALEDYLGETDHSFDVNPARAVELVQRFLDHARRLGFTAATSSREAIRRIAELAGVAVKEADQDGQADATVFARGGISIWVTALPDAPTVTVGRVDQQSQWPAEYGHELDSVVAPSNGSHDLEPESAVDTVAIFLRFATKLGFES